MWAPTSEQTQAIATGAMIAARIAMAVVSNHPRRNRPVLNEIATLIKNWAATTAPKKIKIIGISIFRVSEPKVQMQERSHCSRPSSDHSS